MSARLVLGAVVGLFVAAAAQAAEPISARETARVLERGQWSAGVFDPLRIGLGNGYEVRGHPLLFFVSPNAVLRKEHLRAGEWTLTGEYGLSIPTPVFLLARGYLFRSEEQIGWIVVPRAGLVATLGEPQAAPWSVSVDLALGLPLTRTATVPLDTYAPLETLLAPALGGYRVHAGIAHDRPLLPWLRARGYAGIFVHPETFGPQLTIMGGVGVDLAVGSRGRLTLGAVWWSSNQMQMNAQGQFVRNNDFYPTLDFIWGLP